MGLLFDSLFELLTISSGTECNSGHSRRRLSCRSETNSLTPGRDTLQTPHTDISYYFISMLHPNIEETKLISI